MNPVRPLLARLPQGEFFRGAATIAGGTGVAQLLTILVSPILTRLYAPSDYGAYAVAASLLAVLLAVACLAYESAIPLPRSDGEAANVLVLCLLSSAAVALISVPIVLVVEPLLDAASVPWLGVYMVLLPLGVLAGGALTAFTGWMVRMKSYTEIATNRLAQSVALVATQIWFGLERAGAAGLLGATVVASLVGTGRLGYVTFRRNAAAFDTVSVAQLRATAIRYRRFPLLSAPSTFLNTLGLVAPVILIVASYGPTVGGQFAFAQRVMGLPVILLAAAVSQVYFGEAARLVREEPAGLRTLFRRTTRTLALTAIGPFLLAAIVAPFAFGIVFGHPWAEAGLYAAILAPMYFLQFVSAPAAGTLDVLERQDQHFIREVLRLVLLAGAVVAASMLHLPPVGAIAFVSIAGCITYILYAGSAWRAILARGPGDGVDPGVGGAVGIVGTPPSTAETSPLRSVPTRTCVRCVMDTSDPDVGIDAAGVCRYCRSAERILPPVQPSAEASERELASLAERIHRAGVGKEYDAVVGLSGGVDSSYAAHLAHGMGLRLLAIHFDNGWDSELAVGNIQRIVEALDLDLSTYVIDWTEFRDLQRSFLKASVIDIEILSDHAIYAAMLNVAKENDIRFVVSGSNLATEHGLPPAWVWSKQDWTNIQAIHAAYGSVPLKSFPHLTTTQRMLIRLLGRDLEVVEPLNLVRYRRDEAAEALARLYGWREYGGKHHESLFTKFYQGYILPVKFGVDKRRVHLSDLIRNGELTRDEALAELARPPYDPVELAREKAYVIKKLGFTEEEFAAIMAEPPRPHEAFASDRRWTQLARRLYRPIGRIRRAR